MNLFTSLRYGMETGGEQVDCRVSTPVSMLTQVSAVPVRTCQHKLPLPGRYYHRYNIGVDFYIRAVSTSVYGAAAASCPLPLLLPAAMLPVAARCVWTTVLPCTVHGTKGAAGQRVTCRCV